MTTWAHLFIYAGHVSPIIYAVICIEYISLISQTQVDAIDLLYNFNTFEQH